MNYCVLLHCVLLFSSCKYTPPPPAFIAEFRRVSLTSHSVNLLRFVLRILRTPCELLGILSLCSCFIFFEIDSVAACVCCGVPASVIDFLSWALVNQLRLLLRILRKPCEVLCILSLSFYLPTNKLRRHLRLLRSSDESP